MVGITPANITRLRLAGEAESPRATQSSTHGTTQGTGGPAGADQAGRADTLRLSDQARTLSEGMARTPPVDGALVARLGSAIAEGRYPLDPERIAAAICADCFDLPG